MFDAIAFYRAMGIDHRTEGHKHCRPGWVQVECPFCTGNPGYHLGYNLSSGVFACYRCTHPKGIATVISALAGCDEDEAWDYVREYQTEGGADFVARPSHGSHNRRREADLPPDTLEVFPRLYANYLRGRRFNPKTLRRIWELRAVGPGGGMYAYRILIPIYLTSGHMVSWIARDITDRATAKYLPCEAEHEALPHKECLYGISRATGDSAVVVEGATDVWRLGPGAVATFGIKWTNAQAAKLLKFKRVFIVYDPEPTAQEQARKLAQTVGSLGVETEVVTTDSLKDPGSWEQSDADDFMKELGVGP